jgi:hypothetical protein
MSPYEHNDKNRDKRVLMRYLLAKGGVCDRYNDLRRNQGKKEEYVFAIDDLKKPYPDGFNIIGFDMPYLRELLQVIQVEDGFIEVKGDKFILLQKGIDRCLELYPWMR